MHSNAMNSRMRRVILSFCILLLCWWVNRGFFPLSSLSFFFFLGGGGNQTFFCIVESSHKSGGIPRLLRLQGIQSQTAKGRKYLKREKRIKTWGSRKYVLHKDDLTGRHVSHIYKKGPTGVPEGIFGETVTSKASLPPKATQPMMHLTPPPLHHTTLCGSGLKSDHENNPS